MSLRSIIIKIYKKKPNPLLRHSARLYGSVRRTTRRLEEATGTVRDESYL